MKAFYYVLVLVLIFFRCIVIEAAKKKIDQKEILPKNKYSHRLLAAIICEYIPLSTHHQILKSLRKKKSPPRKFQKEIDCDVSFE